MFNHHSSGRCTARSDISFLSTSINCYATTSLNRFAVSVVKTALPRPKTSVDNCQKFVKVNKLTRLRINVNDYFVTTRNKWKVDRSNLRNDNIRHVVPTETVFGRNSFTIKAFLLPRLHLI